MSLYRIRLELLSALATPLKGDTIWGHIAWGIANHEGDEAVSLFLEECGSGRFAVSSAFPAGCVCRPLLPPKEREGDLGLEDYVKIKKEKKRKFVCAAEYISLCEDKIIHNAEEPMPVYHEAAVHNTIDRETGSVLEQGLYATEILWYGRKNKKSLFDIYIETAYLPQRLTELFVWAFENGYGADASSGKGVMRIAGEPVGVSVKKQGKQYMALGPFVKSKNDDFTDLRAEIFTRTGRIGGWFVSSGMLPYKKTAVLFDEGAVFCSKREMHMVGDLLRNIHADERICQSGFAPVIPIG